MFSVQKGLRQENGSLRGLTGQGEPGLWTLLGGTGEELDSSQLRLSGGAGQVSATSRIARINREKLLASVASGESSGGGGYQPPTPGLPGGGGGPGPPVIA